MLTVVVAATIALGIPAVNQPTPIRVTGGDYSGGVIQTTVTVPGSLGTGSTSADSGASGRRCSLSQVYLVQQLPVPDTLRGIAGTWWQEVCNSRDVGVPVFIPVSGANPAATTSPAELAQRAENRLPLPAPDVSVNPARQGLVNLPEWFWVSRSGWRVLRQRTQVGAVWAEVTARPTELSWLPGDGAPAVSCPGPGTAYDANRPAGEQSTACSYTYRRSSAGEPADARGVPAFPVTVRVSWQVSWRGSGGAAGTLRALSRSSRLFLPVAQRESVVTDGSS